MKEKWVAAFKKILRAIDTNIDIDELSDEEVLSIARGLLAPTFIEGMNPKPQNEFVYKLYFEALIELIEPNQVFNEKELEKTIMKSEFKITKN